jgi:hypothetical protein
MKRLLLGGFVVFAGAAFQPGNVPFDQRPDYRNDPRLHAIRSFFEQRGCPAVHFAETFLQAADDYALDWRLLPSLSFVESTGGKAARNNNLFGWDNGKARFDTPSAGIHTVGFLLASSDLYRDKQLDELLATYNPNSGYVQKVKSIMRRIAPLE